MAELSAAKTVLLVDDDTAILRMMKAMLESEGYSVIPETSGVKAVEIAKNAKIIAVLLDLHLEGMDGFEILEKVHEAKPLLPIIMVTGSHDENEAKKAFDLGAWDYVTKPIDFAYLKNILLMQSPE